MIVRLAPRAEKELRKLAKLDQIAVVDKMESLPKVTDVKKLGGYANLYRTRVGNYRIVYRVFPKECYVELIGHRRDIYEKLARLPL